MFNKLQVAPSGKSISTGKKYIPILVLVLCTSIYFIFQSCKSSSNPVSPSTQTIPTKTISGHVQLPSGSPVNYSNLKVYGVDVASVNSSGNFNVKVFDNYYGFLRVRDNSGHLIAMAYDDLQNGIVINEISTSLSLILSIPINWTFVLNKNISDITNSIRNDSKFGTLNNYVKNLMINDPYNILNGNVHPELTDLVELIAEGILNLKTISDGSMGLGGPEIVDGTCKDRTSVTINNPKDIPFGISGFNLNGDPKNINSYFYFSNPKWIESSGLLTKLLGGSTRSFETGTGDYLMCFGKPVIGELKSLVHSDVPNPDQPHSLYEIQDKITSFFISSGNYREAVRRIALVKGCAGFCWDLIILGFQFVPKGGGYINVGVKAYQDFLNTDKPENVKIIVGTEAETVKSIAGYLKDDPQYVNDVSSFLNMSAESFQDGLNFLIDVFGVVKWIDLTFKVWDIITSDNYIYYTIHKDINNTNNNSCIKSNPPNKPSVNCPSQITYGSSASIIMQSADPDNKQVQFVLVFDNDWTNLQTTSLVNSNVPVTYNYTPTRTGMINISVFAKNTDYAMSGSNNVSLNVIPSGSFFSEGYESYPTGNFTSTPIWNVSYLAPSEVRIVNYTSTEGSQSAEFIGNDPSIGDPEGHYADMMATLGGDPTTVQFSMKVDYIDDAFGVRTWGTYENWNTMGYFVVIQGGSIKWVKKGYNVNDPNDFVPIQSITAGTWYNIKLTINWSSSTYNIYINDVLKVSNAIFVGNNLGYPVHSARLFHCIAFIDTKCRAAYLDNILMQGASPVNQPNIVSQQRTKKSLTIIQ